MDQPQQSPVAIHVAPAKVDVYICSADHYDRLDVHWLPLDQPDGIELLWQRYDRKSLSGTVLSTDQTAMRN